MRTVGSKVKMHASAQICGVNNLVWARMDFQYGGDYTGWQNVSLAHDYTTVVSTPYYACT